jgi:Rieske 2Fe-2S family protein
VFWHALHPAGDDGVPSFTEHLGDLARLLAPYACGRLVLAARHTYDVAANWKVIAENYHECYHCPLIHPELCRVSPPDSGDNYDLPGAWVGGSMDLREGVATMSLTGDLAATPLPGVDPKRVEYLHLLPDLLVSAHPDYVMAHRMMPLAADRTRVECSWLVAPRPDGSAPEARGAVEFWDLTNRQDWAACESVQRGLASPHFRPGPFAPNEDAVAQLVATINRAYEVGRFGP